MPTSVGELEARVPSMPLRVYSATSSQWRSGVKVTVVRKGKLPQQSCWNYGRYEPKLLFCCGMEKVLLFCRGCVGRHPGVDRTGLTSKFLRNLWE